jgi:ZIP family zinc transporter
MRMNPTIQIILYSSAAGLPIIIGGLFARLEEHFPRQGLDGFNHWIIAFGGGALLSAIAFALVPHALGILGTGWLILFMLAGTFAFMAVDVAIARIGASLAQVLSMLMDFLPEALALGASFSRDHRLGLLIAIFIGLQNLPEGFNSYRELRGRLGRGKTLLILFALSFIGIFAALAGKALLSGQEGIIAAIMLFAAGGILYLVFQDIAPLSRRKNDWVPATGASMGFLLGMLGEKLLG